MAAQQFVSPDACGILQMTKSCCSREAPCELRNIVRIPTAEPAAVPQRRTCFGKHLVHEDRYNQAFIGVVKDRGNLLAGVIPVQCAVSALPDPT